MKHHLDKNSRENKKIYNSIPPTVEQVILIENIKSIVQLLVSNKSTINNSKKDIDFVEQSLNLITTHLINCSCDFGKEGINELEKINNLKLDELELRVKTLEKEREELKKEKIELSIELKYCPLTKIFSRYQFNLQFETIIDNYNKNGKSFTFALLDLDQFKKVNDTYGHLYGDHVLYVIGVVLKQQFIDKGISVFRIGGEEFAIIANDNYDKTYILNELKKLLSKLNENYIIEKGSKSKNKQKIKHKQTFSASVKFFEGNQYNKLTYKCVFNEVDKVLYKIKNNGRNEVRNVN